MKPHVLRCAFVGPATILILLPNRGCDPDSQSIFRSTDAESGSSLGVGEQHAPVPMDFSARFEAWPGGCWYTFVMS